MTETAIWVASGGAVFASLFRYLPSIVWSIRCPKDSPHYTHPPLPTLGMRLFGPRK